MISDSIQYCAGCRFACAASDCECTCHTPIPNTMRFGMEAELLSVDLHDIDRRGGKITRYCKAIMIDEDTFSGNWFMFMRNTNAYLRVRNSSVVVLTDKIHVSTVAGDDFNHEFNISIDIDTVISL